MPCHGKRQGFAGTFCRMRIAVLFGGETEERDVSVTSAAQIIPALRSRGHRVLAVDTAFGAVREADEAEILSVGVGHAPPTTARLAPARRAGAALRIPDAVRQSDLVFLALHGGSGEDGIVQALLDLAGGLGAARQRARNGQGREQDAAAGWRSCDPRLACRARRAGYG